MTGETAAEPNETFAVNLSRAGQRRLRRQPGRRHHRQRRLGHRRDDRRPSRCQAGGDDVNEEADCFHRRLVDRLGRQRRDGRDELRWLPLHRRHRSRQGAVISSARLELRSASDAVADDRLRVRHRGGGQQRAVLSGEPPVAAHPAGAAGPALVDVQWLAGTWYQLDQLASLLQPVVNQAGWASGNAVSLVVRGAGQNWARKFATAFEGGAGLRAAAGRHLLVRRGVAAQSLSIADVSVPKATAARPTPRSP